MTPPLRIRHRELMRARHKAMTEQWPDLADRGVDLGFPTRPLSTRRHITLT